MAEILRLVSPNGRDCLASSPADISRLLYAHGYRLAEPHENWPAAPVVEPEPEAEPEPDRRPLHKRLSDAHVVSDDLGSTDPAPADTGEGGSTA